MKTAIALLSLLASPAMAVPVAWTEWTAVDDFTAAGTLTLGSQTVDVGLSSDFPLYFVDPGTGTDWWTGDAYTKGEVSNAPSGGDIVALGLGSVVTVTFSRPLTDIYLAYVSWNLPASIWISTPATLTATQRAWPSRQFIRVGTSSIGRREAMATPCQPFWPAIFRCGRPMSTKALRGN